MVPALEVHLGSNPYVKEMSENANLTRVQNMKNGALFFSLLLEMIYPYFEEIHILLSALTSISIAIYAEAQNDKPNM